MKKTILVPGPGSCYYCLHWQPDHPEYPVATGQSGRCHRESGNWPTRHGPDGCSQSSLDLPKFFRHWRYKSHRVEMAGGMVLAVTEEDTDSTGQG